MAVLTLNLPSVADAEAFNMAGADIGSTVRIGTATYLFAVSSASVSHPTVLSTNILGCRWLIEADVAQAITALTGDGTAAGPGSSAFALATALKGPNPKAGTALTDADATIQPVSDGASWYTLPAAVPLTGNKVLTLGITGAVALAKAVIVTVERLGAGAFTLTVKDSGGATLSVVAVGEASSFYFDTGTGLYKYLSTSYVA